MSGVRMQAWATPAAFAVVAAVLSAVRAVSAAEAAVAAAAVAVAMLPSGWLAPGGWRRRAAEAALLPPACALTMIADPTMRRMAVPPLLVLAALAATLAALSRVERRHHALLVAALALAVRLAGGLGLIGAAPPAAIAALLAPGAIAWALTRWGGAPLGIVAALLAGALPLEHHAVLAGVAAVVACLVAALVPPVRMAARAGRGWLPGALAGALLASSVAPWGGIPLDRELPSAGWPALAGAAAACVVTPLLPVAAAGAAWLGVATLLGPVEPAPPDRAGLVLTAASPSAALPKAAGGTYLTEVALANASGLPAGTVVATVDIGGTRVALRAGVDTAEWAHERDDVRARAAHPLPQRPVWRPTGLGAGAVWGVAGQLRSEPPPGAVAVVTRADTLPATVTVNVLTAGPSRPTPPRDWELPAWLLASALLVAALQLATGAWKAESAWLPWALLGAGALAARAPVEPLRLLAERHAVDLALAAALAAWLPAARHWLAGRRVFVAAAALLVPLAIATPHLMGPGGDEAYHLIMLRSMAQDHDLRLDNNYDLDRFPGNAIYVTPLRLHSPVLAALLLPGFVAAGRSGALVLLALAGAGVAALVARRASSLGLPRARTALLVGLLCATYPLATYSTQIWTEMPGALAAALCLVLVASSPSGVIAAAGVGLLATAVKTRLALVTFPVALAGLVRFRANARKLAAAAVPLALSAAAALAVGVLLYGHPLGPFRRFGHLLPSSVHLASAAAGGLLFDCAGGLVFSAPLLAVALAGLPALWRRGGAGERGLIVGLAATFAALLASIEWYGGGSPPLRYLVPALPVLALAGAALMLGRARGRRLAVLVLPYGLLVWWVVVTRPHLAFNAGDGGWWLANALAVRFHADAWRLFPSFLTPRPATLLVPALLVAAALAALAAAHWRPAFARLAARLAVALTLLVAAAVVLALVDRHDTVVEIEEPQVTRHGGRPEPPPGTFSRYLHDIGWRLGNGDEVAVPLNLGAGARVALSGWVEGVGAAPATLLVRWDDGGATPIVVRDDVRGTVTLPAPPGPGRHRLHLRLAAPDGGEAVLDRVAVLP